jgi:hypothetical protein
MRALRALAGEVTAAAVPRSTSATRPRDGSGGEELEVWKAVSARLDAGPSVILPTLVDEDGGVGRSPRFRRTVAATAAALLVSVAGLGALTFTPLGPALWRMVTRGQPVARQQALPAGSVEVEVPEAGLTVRLADVDGALRLRLMPWDDARLALVPSAGDGRLDFRSSPTQVRVSGSSTGILELRVPAHGGPVRILVRDVTVAVVRDGWVRAAGLSPARTLESDVRTLLSAATGRRP